MGMIKKALKKSSCLMKIYGNTICFFKRLPFFLAKQPKTITFLKNQFAGQSCFIVATGPSLTISDLELIKGHYSFGCNSIVKSFDKTDWRPDFYCLTDPLVFKNLIDMIPVDEIKHVFLPIKYKKTLKNDRIDFFNLSQASYYKGIYYNRFSGILYPSKHPNRYFSDGTSVIHCCIQIAVYMGFTRIFLLGQDCNYQVDNQHSNIAQSEIQSSPNTGHTMIEVFENYKNYYEKRGIKIINCTRGGMLETFQRMKLEDAVNICNNS